MIHNMETEVIKIIENHFHKLPERVTPMAQGICNEVYSVDVDGRSVIVRMNQNDYFLRGSSEHIPLFRSKGIKVPEIIFEDFSKSYISYGYQVLERIEGEDLGIVIRDLSPAQLTIIAKEVATIFMKLSDLPTNGKFGWSPSPSSNYVDSWSDVMLEMYSKLVDRNEITGVVGKELIDLFSSMISKYKKYFDSVPSRYVYDDICSKNVIINDGKFNGLVDLDQVMYGDFLEPVGRIKTSWHGAPYGKIYTDAVMDFLELNDKQREMVTVYALLSRILWLSELGIKFNQNTSTDISQDRVSEHMRIIGLVRQDLGS